MINLRAEVIKYAKMLNTKKLSALRLDINIKPKKKVTPDQSRLHYSPGIPLKMNVINPKNDEAFILTKK